MVREAGSDPPLVEIGHGGGEQKVAGHMAWLLPMGLVQGSFSSLLMLTLTLQVRCQPGAADHF